MPNGRRTVAGLALVLTIGTGCGDPEPRASEAPVAPRLPALDAVVAALEVELPEMLREARVPGAAVCVLDQAAVAWCGAAGVRHADNGGPVTDDTLFQAASLSKPVFAYAALRLADRGDLDLDLALEKLAGPLVMGDFLGDGFDDPRARDITARMVLSHTTGFPNWRGRQPLRIQFDPGSRFDYSGEGFVMLQAALQAHSALTLEQLAASEVFQPLGMSSSTFTAANVDLERYAHTHDATGTAARLPDHWQDRIRRQRPNAAATLITTARQYAQFVAAVATGEGLAPATHAAMLEAQSWLEASDTIAWGLGIGLEVTGSGRAAWHWGDNGDTKAFFLVDLDTGRGMVLFANGCNGLALVPRILEIIDWRAHPVLESPLMAGYPALGSPSFRFMTAVYDRGAAGGLEVIADLGQEDGSPPVAEGTVNALGYWLLEHDRVDEALALFELNVGLYPESWNPWDSLGEGLLRAGRRDDGVAAYRRSLELNSDNVNARRVLDGPGA